MVTLISQGDRGPAVEDVQRRLLALGFDLGPSGVDGVFMGATLAAVRSFQREHGLSEDGVVGDETWSALVDATFHLGDRLLYLKMPHLHGADVHLLQCALNVLGFSCGPPDGIFGVHTERAVAEFQSNVGLPRDGIAGPETVRAVERLRHIWEGRDPSAPVNLVPGRVRAVEALSNATVYLVCEDDPARVIARRVSNLAAATEPSSRVLVSDMPRGTGGGVVLRMVSGPDPVCPEEMPVIRVSATEGAEGRFVAAFQASGGSSSSVYVVIPASAADSELTAQTVAVRVLDGLCAVLSNQRRHVVT